jgi:hypothetical protein
MGGMGMGGMGMGGMGMGHMGMGGMGMGGMGGRGFGNRGFGFGGFGGFGFFPGFWGFGPGWGYPFLGGGFGYGYPYYGGFGYPYYDGFGYGNPYYGGFGYPDYGYGYGNPYYATNFSSPGVGVTYTSAYVAPTGSAANMLMPVQGRYLGIDEEPVVDSTGRRGMKVTNVYPGTAAQRAGLRVGDVFYSINGYLTEQRGNLAWIIANAAPNNQLNMTVKRSIDGQEQAITAQLQ